MGLLSKMEVDTMRRLDKVFACIAALALACATADSPEERVMPSGRVLGSVFTPVEASAKVGAPADCGGATFVAKTLLMFSSRPNLCSELPDACYAFANATGVVIVLERIGTTARPALGPGTYSVGATGETDGQLLVYAYASRTDSSCGTTASADAGTGTVTIDTIDTAVRGQLDLAFPSGEGFKGAFEAPLCAGTYDTCNGDACTSTHVCVQ